MTTTTLHSPKIAARTRLIALMHAIFNVQAEKNLEDVCAAMYAVAELNGVTFDSKEAFLLDIANDEGFDSKEYEAAKDAFLPYDTMQQYFENMVNTEAMGKSLLKFTGLCELCFDFKDIKTGL